ncbi:hypothetical protein AAA799D07_00468, partial [Marine Group I thaumarchaeote SCGC AAA799-D07]
SQDDVSILRGMDLASMINSKE